MSNLTQNGTISSIHLAGTQWRSSIDYHNSDFTEMNAPKRIKLSDTIKVCIRSYIYSVSYLLSFDTKEKDTDSHNQCSLVSTYAVSLYHCISSIIICGIYIHVRMINFLH